MRALEKIRIRGDFSNDTINYLLVKDSKFARFYFLAKIHQRLHNFLDKPVMQNCGLCTQNISSFLDQYLESELIHKRNKSFLGKINSMGQLLKGAIFYTIDVVDFYPNIPHEEGLASLRKLLDARTGIKVTTGT